VVPRTVVPGTIVPLASQKPQVGGRRKLTGRFGTENGLQAESSRNLRQRARANEPGAVLADEADDLAAVVEFQREDLALKGSGVDGVIEQPNARLDAGGYGAVAEAAWGRLRRAGCATGSVQPWLAGNAEHGRHDVWSLADLVGLLDAADKKAA